MGVGKGLDKIPLRIPEKWSAVWFESFVREVLALGDVRNADAGPGIAVTGGPSDTATISGSVNVDELTDSNFILAEPSALLANARVIDGEASVVSIVDGGPSGLLRIEIASHGITFSKMRLAPPLSALVNDANVTGEITAVAALANDTILRRVADVLTFGQLTVGMAPDSLWTYAKIQNVSTTARILGRKTTGAGVIEEVSVSEALDFVSTTPGAILYRGASTWVALAPGSNGDILTLVAGLPAWVTPGFALKTATFVTSAVEATLTNSRQLVSGTGSTVNTGTAGQIKVNVP